jgi:hypothetical protein
MGIDTTDLGFNEGRSRVKESLMGDRYMSEDEAREFIGSMDGDAVTDATSSDEETGEV